MRRVRAARRAERNGYVPSHSNLVLGGRGKVGVEAGAVVGEELPPGLRHVGGRGERKSEHALVQEDGEVEGPDPHWLDGVPHSGHIHIHSAGSLGGEQHLRREHLVDDGGGERAVGGLGAAIKEPQSRSSHQRGNQGGNQGSSSHLIDDGQQYVCRLEQQQRLEQQPRLRQVRLQPDLRLRRCTHALLQ